MYLAQDLSGAKVALKELVFALVPTVDALEAFEREGKFLQRLEHPGIPRFVESFRLGTAIDASEEKLPLSPARRRILLRLVEPRRSARFA